MCSCERESGMGSSQSYSISVHKTSGASQALTKSKADSPREKPSLTRQMYRRKAGTRKEENHWRKLATKAGAGLGSKRVYLKEKGVLGYAAGAPVSVMLTTTTSAVSATSSSISARPKSSPLAVTWSADNQIRMLTLEKRQMRPDVKSEEIKKILNVRRQRMDDYTEPKDARPFAWRSEPSDEEGDGSYSEPYQFEPVLQSNSSPKKTPRATPPGQPGPMGNNYEVAGSTSTRKAPGDYDVPPPPIAMATCEYSRLGQAGSEKAAGSTPLINGGNSDDGECDVYNHTLTWKTQKTIEGTKGHISEGVKGQSSPSRTVSLETPRGVSDHSSGQEGSDSGSVSRNVSAGQGKLPGKAPSRQRVIYPRKGSSGSPVVPSVEVDSGPAVYEEAWDSTQLQQRLEENIRFARSISSASDKFEDALEFLPESHTPPVRHPSGGGGGRKEGGMGGRKEGGLGGRKEGGLGGRKGSGAGGRQTDPVTGGTYEDAWDLNRNLEERLRSLQMLRLDAGKGPEGGKAPDMGKIEEGGPGMEEGNYMEPWNTADLQRQLEEKVQQARAARGGSIPKQLSHPPYSPEPSGLYEEAWDKKGLSHILQGCGQTRAQSFDIPSNPSTSLRPTVSVPCTIGEAVNAMIPLQNQDWYHGNISRDDAEKILRVCKNGSYLVRDSSDRSHYTLSIKSPAQTIHIQIDQCMVAGITGGMRYILGKNSQAFATVPSMIDHYTHHPVPIRGASHITLLHPVMCHWSRTDDAGM